MEAIVSRVQRTGAFTYCPRPIEITLHTCQLDSIDKYRSAHQVSCHLTMYRYQSPIGTGKGVNLPHSTIPVRDSLYECNNRPNERIVRHTQIRREHWYSRLEISKP